MGLLTLFLERVFLYNISMKISEILLLIFVWGLFAPAAFAQKQFKYVPRALGQTRKVPYVVNPKLPPAVRVQFAQPVVHLNTVPTVERAVSAQVAAQTAPRVPVAPSNLQKDILTGVQALQKFRPGWKSEFMLSGFTRQQLDLVEQAFKETDQFLFETDEEGNWLKPRFAEWNYLARYTKILTDNAYGELSLNDGQIKTLFGKFSRLDDVFTRLNYQAFLLVHKRAPNTNDPGEEGKLARHAKYNLAKRDGRTMNPEVESHVYGTMPAKLKTPKPSYGPKRTPEQIWEEVTQFIREYGRIPMRTANDEYERKLRTAWERIYQRMQTSNDPSVLRLIRLHVEMIKKISVPKTPHQVLEGILLFMKEHNGKLPLVNSVDPVEKTLRQTWNRIWQNHKNKTPEELAQLEESIRKIVELHRENIREISTHKTPQEVLDRTLLFMDEHDGKFPSRSSQDPVEKALGQAGYRIYYSHRNDSPEELAQQNEVTRKIVELFQKNVKEIAVPKTPQEWLEIVEPWIIGHHRWPSKHIKEEKQMYTGAYKAMKNHPDDPASKRLRELKEKYL